MKGGNTVQSNALWKWLFRRGKRQKLTVLSAFFAGYVLLLSGMFAYFHSKDAVANRFSAQGGSVTLLEPDWDYEGQDLAKISEPGMQIKKNPYGFNNGQVDLYIRLKLTITLDGYTPRNDTYETSFPDDADGRARRLKSIAEAIRLNDGTPLLTLDTTGNVSSWTAACSNTDFQIEPANASGSDDSLVFYFYYTGSSGTVPNDNMAVVQPQQGTTELFRRVDIPVLKKDWLGVFDQRYTITMAAEAIPTVNYPVLPVLNNGTDPYAISVFGEEFS